MKIADFINIKNLPVENLTPWEITSKAPEIIRELMQNLGDDYVINNGSAIHKTAEVEKNAALKGPCIIGPRAFVASSALLRGGVYLAEDVIIGPNCEIKTSFFLNNSKAAHLSFVGDSVIGSNVNIEAGAMLANYRNEKADKQIYCLISGNIMAIGVEKFGALVGDGCRIGANAVLAPGTILEPSAIVKRLELIDQTGQ